MKYIFILIWLLAGCLTPAYSQDYKKEIRTAFSDYLDHIIAGEYDEALNYVSPEFFTLIDRDQMLNIMEATFNNPEIEFEIINPEILEIGDTQQIDKKYYCLFSYSNQLNMRLTQAAADSETEAEKEASRNIVRKSLETTFGEENVSFNPSTGFFEIQVIKDVCAISENDTSDWKFIVLEKQQLPLLQKILPEAILEKI